MQFRILSFFLFSRILLVQNDFSTKHQMSCFRFRLAFVYAFKLRPNFSAFLLYAVISRLRRKKKCARVSPSSKPYRRHFPPSASAVAVVSAAIVHARRPVARHRAFCRAPLQVTERLSADYVERRVIEFMTPRYCHRLVALHPLLLIAL